MTLPTPLRQAQPGQRWVIRHRLDDGSASDLIGWLVGVDDGVVLDAADGVRHIVSADRVIVARRAPAAAGAPHPRRVGAEEIEQHSVGGWLADSEPLGEWTLRSGGGFTGRANSCLAVGDPGLSAEHAAERIIAYAVARDIPAMAQVIAGSEPERALRALGWADTYVPTEVLAVRLTDLLGERDTDPAVELADRLDDDWLAAYQRSRPNDADPAVLAAILDGRPPRALAAIRIDGEITAIARGHLSGSWLGLASIWTAPTERRQGHATAMIVALGHWAARRGARYAYLQVAAANTSAIAAYARLGFEPHHRYLYLRPPPSPFR